MSETLEQQGAGAVRFSPRRLAHANLFVSDLERSMAFYNKVAGLEEVRREPGITAGFLTNGNTHHDVGMLQVTTEPRVGVGGHVQIPKGRGKVPGLNHLGWEMANEAELVAAYRRALKAGVRIHRRANHQISHSIYLFDPDGNLDEFYADALKDWRSIFNPSREDLVTSEWEVDSIAEPDAEPKYEAHPDFRKVEDAALHPLRITGAVLIAHNYRRMVDFYEGVGGLEPRRVPGKMEATVLTGKLGRPDLVIFPKADGLETGLHHVEFELASESEYASACKRLAAAGIPIERKIDNEDKCSLFLNDPDGIRLEFCYRRREGVGDFSGQPERLAPFYV